MRQRILMAGVLLLVGCATVTTPMYEGSKRPESEVVKITGMSAFDLTNPGLSASVCEFDGQKFNPCKPSVEFLPGKHTLVIHAGDVGIRTGTETVTIEFEAGDRYFLGLSSDGKPALFLSHNINITKH